jgi:PAS domain S-box-containing protein
MRHRNGTMLMRYGCAALSVALATWIRLLLDSVLGNQFPYATFFFAVLLTTWYGGFGPALAAVIFGALSSTYFLIPPRGTFAIEGWDQQAGMVLYLTTSFAIALLGGAMRVAQRRAERAKEAERRQREQLQITLKSIGDAVLTTDAQGRVTALNPVAESLTGWTNDEATNESLEAVFVIVNEATRQPVENPATRALREGTIVGLANHTVLIARDGAERPIDDSAAPIRNAEGGIIGVVLVFRDVTERRRLERLQRDLQGELERQVQERTAELRATEERFRLLVEGTRDYAIFMLDPEGRVVTWNPGAERIKGFAADEIIGQHISRFYPKEAIDQGWPAEELRRASAEGRFEDEGWRVRKDGSTFWANVIITALHEEAGKLRGFSKITRDLTERKRAEESARRLAEEQAGREAAEESQRQLQASEERLRQSEAESRRLLAFHEAVTANMGEGLYAVDTQGLVTYMNPAAEGLFGWTSAELLGRKMHDLTHYKHPDGSPFPVEECAGFQVLHQGKILHDYEDVFIRKNGAFFPVVYSSAPLVSEGKVAGLVVVFRDVTERKRADEALRQQKEWLRVTLASIGDAVITTDTKGRVTFLNPVAKSLTGWDQEEAQGQPLEAVFPILHERTRRQVENPVTKVIREGVIVGLGNHTVLVARDGTERPIDDSAAPIRNAEGELIGVVLVFRDVTEQRQSQVALRHSEARKGAILDTALDGIITIDQEGKIVEFNPAAERAFGYQRAEMLGREMAELIVPPSLREAHRRGLAHYLATGEGPVLDKRLEMPALRADGTEFPVELAITRITGEGPPLFTAYLRDITERKRAEQATRFLADASTSLAILMDDGSTMQKVAHLAVPSFADWCAVDLLEPDGSLRRVAVAHADPSKVELAHELHRRYPHDPDAQQGVAHILRTGKSELVSEITDALLFETVKDDERLRILLELGLKSYLGVPLQVRGKTVGVLTFVTAESGRRFDATDLAVAEDLAHRAGVAMENARLYTEVRDADRRKDEFLALLAHELRNPLAPIRNALHIMKQAGSDAAVVDQVREMMERQVQHMTRMVDDLLDVSRITRGKIELRKEIVDLASVVQRTVEAGRPLIDDRHQTLTVDLPSEPLRLEADPTRLEQVFANLLNNATKYTDQGGHIKLSARQEGGELVLRVRDTGAGIAPEMLAHIFEPFVQADRVLHQSQGGLGIGLTLVRRLVEMHGGTVTAHSEGPSKGSEFIVRLPALSPKQPISATRTAGDGGAVVGAAPRRRIIVVDDNVDAAESLAMLLRMEGHDVRVAHDGPAALSAVEANPPDLVFLDIGMPVMNGYDVARQLRRQPGLENLVLVAMTGWGQEEDRRRSQEAGFDHHLVKPAEPEALRQLLARPQ